MAKNVNHVSLIKSTNTAMTSGDSVFIASGQTGPKLPTPDVLIQGEIAVNLAKGVETLSIKNTDNEIVTFSSDKIIKKVIVDNERITAAALNDLEVNKQDVLTAGQGIDITNNVISATLDVTVDDALDSGSTNPVANSAITSEFDEIKSIIDENELIIASALNDLEERKLDASAYTPTDLTGYATEEWVEDKLGSGFTGENSGNTVTKVIEDNELAISAALNDLNDRKLDASAYTETDLSDLYALSAVVSANSVVTAAALNDLNTRLLPTITGVSFNEQDAYVEDGVAYLDGISAHTHAISDVDGLQTTLDSKVSGITVNNATKSPTNGVINLGTLVSAATLNGSAQTVTNGTLALNLSANYDSNTKKIYLKSSSTTISEIDATDFIKDGMVNEVKVDEPTSGSNSGVTCLIVTFNTDAGKEDIEIPLSEMFDSSLFYTKTEIDDKLGSGFTGENSGNTVTEIIEENELIVASALNDLEERKLDASAYTPTDLSDLYILSGKVDDNATVTAAALNDLNERLYDKLDASAYTQVEVDFELDSGSTNPVANSAITTTILENEEVVAEALADLDGRISGNTTYITQVNAKADTIARSLSGYTPSGYSYSKGEVEVKLADKLDASAYTPTDLSGYYTKQEIDNNKLGSGFTGDNSGVTVTQAINETEEVVAAALNDLNDRIDSLDGDIDALESAIQNIDLPTIDGDSDLWSSGSTGVPATSALTEVLEEIEEVTATALNDLNEKINEVSGNQLTADSFKTINNESIIGTGNIEIQGGGGSDANALSGVSVNGTAASVSNKVANITSVPADIVASSSTRTFVTSNEKTKIANAITGVSVNGTAATVTNNVAAISALTSGDNISELTNDSKYVRQGRLEDVCWFDTDGYGWLNSDYYGNYIYFKSNNTLTTTGTSTATFVNCRMSYGEEGYSVITNLLDYFNAWNINSNVYEDGKKKYIDGLFHDIMVYVLFGADSNNATAKGVALQFVGSDSAVSNTYTLYFSTTMLDRKYTLQIVYNYNSHAFGTGNYLFKVEDVTIPSLSNTISGVSFNGTDATVTNGKAAISGTVFDGEVDKTTSASTSSDGLYKYYQYANGYSDTGVLFIDREYQGGPQVGQTVKEVLTTSDVTKLHNLPSASDLNNHIEDSNIHVTSAEKTQWNNAISGVSLNGSAVTITDHVANVTVPYGLVVDLVSGSNNSYTANYTYAEISAAITSGRYVVLRYDTYLYLCDGEVDGSIYFYRVDSETVGDDLNQQQHKSENVYMHTFWVTPSGTWSFENRRLISNSTTTKIGVVKLNDTVTSTTTTEAATANAVKAAYDNGGVQSVNGQTGAVSIASLPAVTAADNGKILMVVNGAWALVSPTTIYTGTGTPSSGQGNDGDIYLQTS